MAMRFQGRSYSEIGAAVHISPGTVKNAFAVGGACRDAYPIYVDSVMNRPVPAEQTNAGALSVADRIKGYASTAVDKIGALITGAKHDETQLSAAKDILDRAGYMPVQKMINIHAVEEMTVNELDAFIGGILDNAPKNIGPTSPVRDTLGINAGIHASQSGDISDTPGITGDTGAHDTHDNVHVVDPVDNTPDAYVPGDTSTDPPPVATEPQEGV